jgi:hypothetical protein
MSIEVQKIVNTLGDKVEDDLSNTINLGLYETRYGNFINGIYLMTSITPNIIVLSLLSALSKSEEK